MSQLPGKGQIGLIIDVGNQEIEEFGHHGNSVGALEKTEYCPCLQCCPIDSLAASLLQQQETEHSLSESLLVQLADTWIPSRFCSAPLRPWISGVYEAPWLALTSTLDETIEIPARRLFVVFCRFYPAKEGRGSRGGSATQLGRERTRKRGPCICPEFDACFFCALPASLVFLA
ncbi:hypothetical protein BDP81DRAFT_422184 [Colletotrichum phormii]|uniref:Uncharacterized protein n=1 Tax=Colletotrichum phormii TaxID=359342 RepID=A0AAI9ZXF9_9PEZI|nr:uncharacterized protein BDP81DRAFT_422184 [Colletotrichum phormii]KAK1639973.1 hypothetical protein BDP81DRAFT_422184 [Colletotrichum phormii]